MVTTASQTPWEGCSAAEVAPPSAPPPGPPQASHLPVSPPSADLDCPIEHMVSVPLGRPAQSPFPLTNAPEEGFSQQVSLGAQSGHPVSLSTKTENVCMRPPTSIQRSFPLKTQRQFHIFVVYVKCPNKQPSNVLSSAGTLFSYVQVCQVYDTRAQRPVCDQQRGPGPAHLLWGRAPRPLPPSASDPLPVQYLEVRPGCF